MKIAICDDEEIFAKKLADVVSDYLQEKQILFEIDIFPSGREFVDLAMEMTKYKIVFLDINMEELDGLETARKLRELSRETFLVFVTAYIDYTLDGYKVDAIRYVLKNAKHFKETVQESLDAIFEKMNYKAQINKFKFNEGERKVSLDRILYIESNLHKLSFHVLEDEVVVYTMYETLNRMETEVQKGNFIRVHQSYLVNLNFIRRIEHQQVELSNGTILPIAKLRYKDVRSRFAKAKGRM